VPLHDLKVWVSYAIGAWCITRTPFFVKKKIWMSREIDCVILLQSTDSWRKTVWEFYATQCNITHCEQFYGCIRLSLWWMSHNLWIIASGIIQFNLWDFYLWGILKEKVYVDNLHYLKKLQDNKKSKAIPVTGHEGP
jgi:hypothetical protein